MITNSNTTANLNFLKGVTAIEEVNELKNGDIEVHFFNDELSANDQILKAVMHKDFFSGDVWDLPSHISDETLFFAEEFLNNEIQTNLSIYNQ
jgi:hypothetical protein